MNDIAAKVSFDEDFNELMNNKVEAQGGENEETEEEEEEEPGAEEEDEYEDDDDLDEDDFDEDDSMSGGSKQSVFNWISDNCPSVISY